MTPINFVSNINAILSEEDATAVIKSFQALYHSFQLKNSFISRDIANKLISFYSSLISRLSSDQNRWDLVCDVIDELGAKLQVSLIYELEITGITKRVISVIKDEIALMNNSNSSTTKIPLLDQLVLVNDVETCKCGCVKLPVLEALSNMLEELQDFSDTNFNTFAEKLVSSQNEVILTIGDSSVLRFLLTTALKGRRNAELFICENAPRCDSHDLANYLKSEKIRSQLISDSSAASIMRRVTKVVIESHCVLKNGGIIAHTGQKNICQLAKYMNIPVFVLGEFYKLVPLYPHNVTEFTALGSPQMIIGHENLDINAKYHMLEYIDPNQFSLIVTNEGSYTGEYISYLITNSL